MTTLDQTQSYIDYYVPDSSVLSFDFPVQGPFSTLLVWSWKEPALTSMDRLAVSVTPLSSGVQNFIERNALWPALYVGEMIRDRMTKNHTTTGLQFAVDTDAESPEREDLVLVFSILGKEYSEILNIWNEVSREIHSKLPSTVSEKVSVRLVKA